MTPKEKAKELVEENQILLSEHIFNGTYDIAIKLSLICVDEILNDYEYCQITRNANSNVIHSQRVYWQEVKQEIENL